MQQKNLEENEKVSELAETSETPWETRQNQKSPHTISSMVCSPPSPHLSIDLLGIFQPSFNISAAPFLPPIKKDYAPKSMIHVGPSKVPVNEKIWSSVANNRILPDLPYVLRSSQIVSQLPCMHSVAQQPRQQSYFNEDFNERNIFAGYVSLRKLKLLRSR